MTAVRAAQRSLYKLADDGKRKNQSKVQSQEQRLPDFGAQEHQGERVASAAALTRAAALTLCRPSPPALGAEVCPCAVCARAQTIEMKRSGVKRMSRRDCLGTRAST